MNAMKILREVDVQQGSVTRGNCRDREKASQRLCPACEKRQGQRRGLVRPRPPTLARRPPHARPLPNVVSSALRRGRRSPAHRRAPAQIAHAARGAMERDGQAIALRADALDHSRADRAASASDPRGRRYTSSFLSSRCADGDEVGEPTPRSARTPRTSYLAAVDEHEVGNGPPCRCIFDSAATTTSCIAAKSSWMAEQARPYVRRGAGSAPGSPVLPILPRTPHRPPRRPTIEAPVAP